MTTGVNNLQPIPTGFQYNDNNGVLYRLDENGVKSKTINMPESMHKSRLTSYEADGSLWELNEKGLRHVELTETGAETVLMDFARPNASTVALPYYLEYNKGLDKLYVMNTASTRYISDYLSLAVLSSYDGVSWKNEMPENAPTLNKQGNNNNHINAPYSLVFDPEDPNTCYIGTWFEGVYKLTNGEVVAKYDWTNSAIDKVEIDANFHICTTPCVRFDKNIPADIAMQLFDFYEYVVENAFDGLSDLLARFFCRGDYFYVCVDAVCSIDLTTLNKDDVLVSVSDENCYTLSFKLKAGE